MEKQHFLDKLVQETEPTATKGSHKEKREIWYNPYGDCVQFQTVDQAVIADRIDDYLTIYRLHDNNDAVGFKLKDVRALMNKYGSSGMEIRAAVQGDRLISVTALLLSAFKDLPQNTTRLEAYTNVIRSIPKTTDEVSIPEEIAA